MSEPDPAELALLSSTLRQLLKGEPTLGSLGELGFLGLLVPESAGGMGIGGMGWRVVEACALATEAGRALSPVPWVGTALAAAELAASPRHEPLLAGLLRGDLVGVAARRRDVTFDPAQRSVSGRFTAIGPSSPGVLVLLSDDSSPSLLVELGGPGARLSPLADALDITREALLVTLSSVPAVELPSGGPVPPVALATLLACADSLGALTVTVDLLVEYLSHREAFGASIASFQAIQHRLSDLTVLVSAAGALVRRAAQAIAAGAPEGLRLVSAAQAYLGARCTAALDDCIQLSGGIGFTWEWPVHRAMRRSLVNASSFLPGADLLQSQVPRNEEPESHAEFRARVRAVIAEHMSVAARVVEAREGHRAPTSKEQEAALRQWYRTMYDKGLLGASWPTEWGGRPDHRPWHDLIVTEELIRARAPRPIDQVLLASHVLLRFGTDEQRARYLPRIRGGADIWCQLFSEPDAGSDLAGIKARATRRPDGSWILAGQKTWTTDGHWAQVGLALLRTSASAKRHEGITAFLVPMDRPGLVVRPKPTIGGALEFNDVFLDGVELGPEHVIGEVGQGWAVAMSGLEVERFTVGGNVVLLELLLDDVITVARLVSADGSGNAIDQGEVRAAITQLSSECEAAKAYITNHADRALSGTADDADAPIAKILYSETYNRIARFGSELVARHLPVPAEAEAAAQRLRDAWLWSRAMTISGGSSEIMRNIIARRRLKLPAPM